MTVSGIPLHKGMPPLMLSLELAEKLLAARAVLADSPIVLTEPLVLEYHAVTDMTCFGTAGGDPEHVHYQGSL